jgi:hypothetical protein
LFDLLLQPQPLQHPLERFFRQFPLEGVSHPNRNYGLALIGLP